MYSSNFHQGDISEEQAEIFASQNDIDAEDMAVIVERFELINEKVAEIDDMISKASTNWTIDRISLVDKTLLRIIIFEALYDEAVPVPVALNEGIELAKVYGTDKSPKFINGVAGKVING